MTTGYRTLKKTNRLEDLKPGDLCTIATPSGDLVEGRVMTIIGHDEDANLSVLWFDDGRSYPIAKDDTWTSFCHFLHGWIDQDVRDEIKANNE